MAKRGEAGGSSMILMQEGYAYLLTEPMGEEF